MKFPQIGHKQHMRLIFLLSIVLGALGKAQLALASQALIDKDRAVLCAVSEVALSSLKFISQDIDAESKATIQRIQANAGRYKQLPKKIRCGKQWIRLVPRAFGTYMHSFILSSDRSEIVISGGYQANSLDGASGDCLFRWRGDGWHYVACRVDTVS